MTAERNRTLSLLTVCCFLSGSLFSQAGALEDEGTCCCGTISSPAFEELYEPMALPDDSRKDKACIGTRILIVSG